MKYQNSSSHVRIKMTSWYLFTKGCFYITNINSDSALSSEEKIISWYFFYVKIKASCPRAELPPVQVSCAFGVLEVCFNLYLI